MTRHSRYRPQADDTAPDIDRRLMDAYRAMTPAQKAVRTSQDSLAVERLALAGISLRHPGGSATERLLALAVLRLGEAAVERAYGHVSDGRREVLVSTTDPIALALRLAAILEALGVPWVVGGSVASSVFGEPRSTEDVDFVAALGPRHIAPLLNALGDEFYVDEAAVGRAIEGRSSFNLIHLASARKVDVFVPAQDVLGQRQLQRRRLVAVSETAGLFLLTPEDTMASATRAADKSHRHETSDQPSKPAAEANRGHGVGMGVQSKRPPAPCSGR